ncbi:MAG: tRNA 4-thiouridine(8) synthase ThiI [Candidatus Omnitrophota bacterium]|nr:tRNA 4-thiouridine(8) synthase ThiI [Candidatus Omnitrophota bacterium]
MKAIALISGGLDSILAARLVNSLGVEVIPLNFKIPFCKKDPVYNQDSLGACLNCVDISGEFLKLLENPRHGFGSNMNPCIDCKIMMLSKARQLLDKFGASFVITGEVLGQRPMSQNRQALSVIEKESGLEDLILRPLSARLLPETIPEKQGWVRRQDLLNFSGRTRKPQLELAGRLKIKDYGQPAGGCLLTDPRFSQRLRELIAHKELNADNLELLKVGRHLRISANTKLAVGRNEKENQLLADSAKEGDYLFSPGADMAGPTSLGRGEFDRELIELSCALTCHYCDLGLGASADIFFFKKNNDTQKQNESSLNVLPAAENIVTGLRI